MDYLAARNSVATVPIFTGSDASGFFHSVDSDGRKGQRRECREGRILAGKKSEELAIHNLAIREPSALQ